MPKSYEDLLTELQNNTKSPLLIHLTPQEHQIHEIDLETRTINVPQFLSVRFDHNAEVICFKCPRYFEGVDLADMICVIQYINAEGDSGLYWVPYYDIDHPDIDEETGVSTPTLLIPWAIGGLATIAAGKVQFSVRFYRIEEETKKFLFNLSTKPAVGEILFGLDLPSDVIEDFKLDNDTTSALYQKMFELAGNAATYWTDI